MTVGLPLTPRFARHRQLLTNAGSLFATTAVTSLTGVAFWSLATHLLNVEGVGYASSAVSAMTLIGTVGMLGFGTMLIAEAARVPARSRGLITAALLAAGATSALGALLVVGGARLADAHLSAIVDLSSGAWIVGGAGLTGIAFVLDQALIGLMAGGVQLLRNAVFSVAKLALLALTCSLVSARYGLGALVAWVLGTALSLLLLGPVFRRRALPVVGWPSWQSLRELRGVTVAHSFLNLATQAPRLALPLVATSLISPRAGAMFYIAWMVAQLLYLLPGHLATVLFAIGAGELALLREKLRFTLVLSVLIGLVAGGVIAAAAPLVLNLFGHAYAADATGVLRLLLLGYVPMVVKNHYVAVVRVERRLVLGATVASIGASGEIAAAAFGAVAGGLHGLCVALLAILGCEALVMVPTVARAARSRPTQSA